MVAAKFPYGLQNPLHLLYCLAERLHARDHGARLPKSADNLAGMVRGIDAAGADPGDAAGHDGAWVAEPDHTAAGVAELRRLLRHVQGLPLADAARTAAHPAGPRAAGPGNDPLHRAYAAARAECVRYRHGADVRLLGALDGLPAQAGTTPPEGGLAGDGGDSVCLHVRDHLSAGA